MRPSTTRNRKTTGALRQFVAATSASLTVMTTGCWLGWPSPSIRKLEFNETSIRVNQDQISWIVAAMDAGNVVSSIPAGYLMDLVGRRVVILFSGALFFFTWMLVGLATTPAMLYIARFLAGFGKGITFTVVPMYLGEIASVPIRGALSTVFAGLLWSGTMFEFAIGPYVSFEVLAVLSAIIPVLFFSSFLFMPDSPYYLLMRGKEDEARHSLRWLRKQPQVKSPENIVPCLVEKELKEIKTAVEEDLQHKAKFYDLLSTPASRRATFIVLVISAFQRLCGISPLLAYSSTTLPTHDGLIGPAEVIIVFGCILTVSNFIATPLVDRLGRRPLLLFSGAGCGVLTGISGVYYYLDRETEVDMSSYIWVPYVCLLGFGVTHSMGIGVIPHTLLAELFPTNVKSFAAAIASIMFALASFLVNKLYTTVDDTIGLYANFAFFSVNGFLCTLFTYLFIFETKGKSFVEIQRFLRRSPSIYELKPMSK
ncbi:facilitated trehalose transporter Tret1-like [Macrosteles quadrilineatus]|uniref:facilitated trehalose transporter Tret1-like n=1 Tax=Macrosteles quadrilineatus TaxID=74068 RepID=UPI0023E0E6E3|nr:facilitated trehalose transporter Tret1-like [Macrosteles quadrilineatus]